MIIRQNATIDWNTGPFSVISTTSYGILNFDYVTDATSIEAAPGVTYGDALGGIGLYEDNSAGLKKFTQEIRLASPSTDKLEWQVGGYYTHEDGALLQHVVGVGLPTTPAGNPFAGVVLETVTLDSTYKEWAGFANLTVIFVAVGTIIAGVLSRRADQPQHTFLVTALTLTAMSFVPDLLVDATVATKLTLMLTHVVAASIAIPLLASRLSD